MIKMLASGFIQWKKSTTTYFWRVKEIISLSGLDSIMIKVFGSKSVDREARKIALDRKNIEEVRAHSIEMRGKWIFCSSKKNRVHGTIA